MRSGPPAKLPKDLAAEGHSLAQQYGVGKDEKPDPRAEVTDVARQALDVDRQVDALASQNVDIAAAQQQLAAANDRQTQFLQQISGLSQQQLADLQSLTTSSAPTQSQSETLAAFNRATAALTPEQRKTLSDLNRATQDAQMNLQGQQIAKRIQEAHSNGDLSLGSGERYDAAQEVVSLALADGRAFVADRQRVEADRQIQDVYALAMTPEVNEQLAQPQQDLLAAASYLQPADRTTRSNIRHPSPRHSDRHWPRSLQRHDAIRSKCVLACSSIAAAMPFLPLIVPCASPSPVTMTQRDVTHRMCRDKNRADPDRSGLLRLTTAV